MSAAHKLARRTNPRSSHVAARAHVRSGANRSQKLRVLEALRDRPDSTSAELAQAIGVDRYVTARRLPDLEGDGLVTRGFERLCRVNGTPAITWRLAPQPPVQMPLFFSPAVERMCGQESPRCDSTRGTTHQALSSE